MGVGALMLVVPSIVTITVSSIRIFIPMIGLLLLLFGFPIILSSKKNKNIETQVHANKIFHIRNIKNNTKSDAKIRVYCKDTTTHIVYSFYYQKFIMFENVKKEILLNIPR